jgi:hypothetical protein
LQGGSHAGHPVEQGAEWSQQEGRVCDAAELIVGLDQYTGHAVITVTRRDDRDSVTVADEFALWIDRIQDGADGREDVCDLHLASVVPYGAVEDDVITERGLKLATIPVLQERSDC